MSSEHFTCSYCGRPTTVTDPHRFLATFQVKLDQDSKLCEVYLIIKAISCPNEQCKELYLTCILANQKWVGGIGGYSYPKIKHWQLLPESEAKVLPDFVPKQIIDSYKQACRIRDLSPEASATLARRCLQGMIRDFWDIKKENLKLEVDALEELVDSDTWSSIDAVRSVGNIGAHFEKDINIIVEVEPNEAQLLIGLIEQLVDDWYKSRHDRQERTKKLKELADKKQRDRGKS